jgi:hypothetical protein
VLDQHDRVPELLEALRAGAAVDEVPLDATPLALGQLTVDQRRELFVRQVSWMHARSTDATPQQRRVPLI